MGRVIVGMMGIVFSFLLVACGSIGPETSVDELDYADLESGTGESIEDVSTEDFANSEGEVEEGDFEELISADQKIIYTATVHLEVKDLQKTIDELTDQIQQLGGYMVQSNMQTTNDGLRYGDLIVRVPQEDFTVFLDYVENMDGEVISTNVVGQDVSEEFVDLESRLKSLRVQESRLLEFMEEANDTDDLLKIADDLTDIQEEIDSITGRLRYLENRVTMATVSIHMKEKNIEISSLGEEFNTWERTVEQFKTSINWILQSLSLLIIYVVGNLPIFVLLTFLVIGIVYLMKKTGKRPPKKNDKES